MLYMLYKYKIIIILKLNTVILYIYIYIVLKGSKNINFIILRSNKKNLFYFYISDI